MRPVRSDPAWQPLIPEISIVERGMTLLIKNGTLVTAGETFPADILVEGERIAQIGVALSSRRARLTPRDAGCRAGRCALPFRSADVWHSFPMIITPVTGRGFWRTTTVIDFVSRFSHLEDCVAAWHARNKAAVDYSFHMNITRLYEIP
jgi:dihydropyrimidinase